MRDPGLPVEHFQRDEVLIRESLFNLDDLARVDHASREGDAVSFSSPRRLTVHLRPHSPDLSRYDRLVVSAFNRTFSPLLVGMKLIHGSHDSQAGLPAVSWSGGREGLPPGQWVELKFPKECFGTYGKPAGWTDIRSIKLSFGRDKDAIEEGPVDLIIKSVHGEARKLPQGPRFTAAGLEHLLNQGISDLTDVRRKKDGKSGRSILCDIGSSKNFALFIPPPHPYPKEAGDQVLGGRIMGQALADPIPWDADPLGSQEWTHFLNRHHFLRELVKALAESRDAKYARALDRIILSWITDNPVPLDSNGGSGPAWETLSVAWRLREWLWVIGIAWPNTSFRKTTRLAMLCSVWEHARSLMDHQGHSNNWIMVESAALALAGICFPCFRESGQWRQTGLERLCREVRRQFFPDGAHFELSPLYHAICVHALLEVREAASIRGIRLRPEFKAPLERCAGFLAALYRPDFSWPSLNDSGSADGDYTALMRKAGEMFSRQDFTWIGTRGRVGTIPTKTSHGFSDAGIAIMRSHHGPTASMLLFRAGPAGFAHVHLDALSLEATALGLPRLADPGITTYAPGALTDYYRSADAHSMILIDGKGPEREALGLMDRIAPAGRRFSFVHRRGLELASGLSTGPWKDRNEGLTVLRTVIFVMKEYWIVRDVVAGSRANDVTVLWQFLSDRVEVDIRMLAVSCGEGPGRGFGLIPLHGSAPCSVEQFTAALHPPRGWFSLGGADVPGTTVQYQVRGAIPMVLVWILLPLQSQTLSGLSATREDQPSEIVSLEIRLPAGHTDFVSLRTPSEQDLRMGKDKLHGAVKFRRIRSNG